MAKTKKATVSTTASINPKIQEKLDSLIKKNKELGIKIDEESDKWKLGDSVGTYLTGILEDYKTLVDYIKLIDNMSESIRSDRQVLFGYDRVPNGLIISINETLDRIDYFANGGQFAKDVNSLIRKSESFLHKEKKYLDKLDRRITDMVEKATEREKEITELQFKLSELTR